MPSVLWLQSPVTVWETLVRPFLISLWHYRGSVKLQPHSSTLDGPTLRLWMFPWTLGVQRDFRDTEANRTKPSSLKFIKRAAGQSWLKGVIAVFMIGILMWIESAHHNYFLIIQFCNIRILWHTVYTVRMACQVRLPAPRWGLDLLELQLSPRLSVPLAKCILAVMESIVLYPVEVISQAPSPYLQEFSKPELETVGIILVDVLLCPWFTPSLSVWRTWLCFWRKASVSVMLHQCPWHTQGLCFLKFVKTEFGNTLWWERPATWWKIQRVLGLCH